MHSKNRLRPLLLSMIGLCLSACCATRPPPAPRCPAPPPKVEEAVKPAVPDKKVQGNLVLQGTPEIPASLRARLGQYLNTRWAFGQDLSHDGKEMIITSRFGQTSQVHLVRNPMGARSQVTFTDEPIRRVSFVPGSRDAMVYISDAGGAEAFQIFRRDLSSGRTTLLTDGKSRHRNYVWSHDGKRMAYNSNARNGKDMDLYLGDGVTAAAGKLLLERSGHWYPIDWSHDGKQLLVGEYISINHSRMYVVDVTTKKVLRVTPEKPHASYRQALFGLSGKRVYATTDREGEFMELYEVELATQRWTPLTRNISWNVGAVALSADGRSLAFTSNEDGYSVLYLMDTRSRKARKIAGAPKGVVRGLSFARKAKVLAFSHMSPTSQIDAYTYDLRRRKITRWTASEMGGLDPAAFVSPTLIKYKTFDGQKIPAFYYRPRGAGPFPVVLLIHGGPEGQARPFFRGMVQYLVNERKVAVLQPNVRGSDGYGKAYLLLDNGFKREDSVKDIGALLDWVKAQKELDEKRVAVFGGSYGGYMVLASLVHFADRIVAGVDVVGISNFVTFLKKTKSYRRDLRRAEYGDERDTKMNAFLQKISPSTSADKIRSALFVAHGANDPRVPLSETDQIVAAVRKQGQDVWYMVAKNEGHGFRKKKNRDMFYLLTVLFLEKHLKVNIKVNLKVNTKVNK